MLAVALLSLAGVGYVAETLQVTATERAASIQTEAQQQDRTAYAQRIGAIASDTADERAELEAFMHLDIVSAAEEFERVGTRAGATVHVTDATPQSGGTTLANGETLQWISFSVAAEGSYASLMRALKLYENLPLALEINELELQQAGESSTWQMTLRIRVLAITSDL